MGKLTYNTRLVFQNDSDKDKIVRMLEKQRSGKIYDSDINGAINIGLRSKLPVSCVDANRITYGQANVNSPIVGGSHSQAAIPLG